MTTYRCEQARLPDGTIARDVDIEVDAGRIVAIRTTQQLAPSGGVQIAGDGLHTRRAPSSDDVVRLAGLVLPGLADTHSHAFHRALRGRTSHEWGTFWTWRERMYQVAARLDPDLYLALARAAFAESVLAGTTTVGEFHYLHHGPDGVPYADENAIGHALVTAAREAGLRLTLLDTCYLAGGIDRPLAGVQRRFDDGDADRWVQRVDALADAYTDADDVVIGAAIHSVRAVPRDQLPTVAAWATQRGVPLHAHVSEQRAEDEACVAAYGLRPTALLEEAGALGPRTSSVHATHATDDDLAAYARTGTAVSLCPTTERDLADGVGRADAMRDQGIRVTFGSDSRAVVDPFEEARAAELNLRLVTEERGHLDPDDLLDGLTRVGQETLGFEDAGRLEVGARADLVAVRLDTVRTGGTGGGAAGIVMAASPSDVTDVVVDGRHVVRDGRHALGDVGHLLADAIDALDAARP